MATDASHLRKSLSDELHARAFYVFNGAGRFIRFVYLVGNDDSAVLSYVNHYFLSEFLTISFVQKDLQVAAGISPDAYDQTSLPHMPFDWARNAPAPLFHAV